MTAPRDPTEEMLAQGRIEIFGNRYENNRLMHEASLRILWRAMWDAATAPAIAQAQAGAERKPIQCVDDMACMMPGDCSARGYCIADAGPAAEPPAAPPAGDGLVERLRRVAELYQEGRAGHAEVAQALEDAADDLAAVTRELADEEKLAACWKDVAHKWLEQDEVTIAEWRRATANAKRALAAERATVERLTREIAAALADYHDAQATIERLRKALAELVASQDAFLLSHTADYQPHLDRCDAAWAAARAELNKP